MSTAMLSQSPRASVAKLAFLLLLIPHTAHAQGLEILAAASTAATIKTVSSELEGLIDHAAERGDYLMSGAAIRMKGAIDAWEAANADLLDRAFGELDQAQRDLFTNARALVYRANAGAADRLETAQQITNQANQIVASLPLNKRSYITRQVPRVVSPLSEDTVLVRLWGVNLDRAEPEMLLSEGSARRSLAGPTEVTFHVPLSALNVDSARMQTHTLRVRHRTRAGQKWLFWPRYETVDREILLTTLPLRVATYTLTGTRTFERREERLVSVNAGEFRGKDKTIEKWAHAPEGWRWDLELPIEVVERGGEAGSCSRINLNGANEHGVKVQARVDKRVRLGIPTTYGDGYVNCEARGTVYRMVDDSEAIDPVTGSLTWSSDEVALLPTDVSQFELRVTTFEGRDHVFTGSGESPLVSVDKQGDRLVLRPLVPTDIVR